jgi:hypothetical protein
LRSQQQKKYLYHQPKHQRYKIFCQKSTTNTKVQVHDQIHIHSKKCLKFLRQGCVRPIGKYIPSAGTKLLNTVIPAKDTKHLKSQLVTRYPISNRNPNAGNKRATVLRPTTNSFPTMVINCPRCKMRKHYRTIPRHS